MTVHLPVLSPSGAVQPPPPPPAKISASQLDTFAQCMAKWGYQYLDGHRPPPHPSAQCGTRVHEILEAWLSRGTPPDPNEVLVIGDRVYEVGKIALAGLYNLPAPGPHHDVEGEFTVPFMSGYPALWRGFIDSSYLVHQQATQQDVLLTLSDGAQVLGRVEVVPEILDHKTTTNLDYRKTREDLLTDIQAMIYAWVGLTRVPEAPRVNLRWVYYKTSKPYKSEVTYTTVTREHVMRMLALWEELAIAGPLRAKALGLRGSQLPKNARACGRYGGCPHKDVRCRLTREERIEAAMSTQPDLVAMINQAKDALAGQPSPPPPPMDGTTAPMLGTPPRIGAPTLPPSMQPPPFQPSFQPPQPPMPFMGSAPPMVGLPPVPAPMVVQAALPPPPPPPPPPPAQSLPQPWVLSQDPAWAYNPVTQQFEQTAKLLAPPAPPPPVQAAPPPPPVQAAPPPPPVQAAPPPTIPSVTTGWTDEERKTIIGWIRAGANDQQIAHHFPQHAASFSQLRKDLVSIDEYTARTTAPANPAPLKPEEIFGLKTAIQNGATDMQILAAYPHARPVLDQLRLEVQGPQRATGVNAPESANVPPLAEPAAVAAPAPAPAAPEVDPSKKGDAYDNMGVEQLRAIAKANDIEVKGLREKNLRITVRDEMARRGAPAPVTPATAPVAMQPQQLPNVFATPAAPSIAQAVQTHLQPAPLTQEQMAAIRQALNGLNAVGDALRKLIGAD